MSTSLVSREVIADSIELVTRGNLFDAMVVLVGCDKTIPGGAMALARLDIPGLSSTAVRLRQDGLLGTTSPSRTCLKLSARMRPVGCSDADLGEIEATGLSRRGRLRRPVHRKHDGYGL